MEHRRSIYRLKFFTLAITVLLAMSVCSCTSSEQKCYNDFSTFVDNVEQNAQYYTDVDWKATVEYYEQFSEDLDYYSDLYTPEQNREIGRMKARFHKMVMSYYLNRASDIVNNFSYQMEGYADEMGGDNDDYGVMSSSESFEESLMEAAERLGSLFED